MHGTLPAWFFIMSSSISTLLRSKTASSRPSAALFAAFSGGLLTTVVVRKTSLQQAKHQSNDNRSPDTFQIETDLMERIAQKPYLQAFTSNDQHPKGVPHRLRILAIDVPEMRTAFDGECRINLSKVYADDIAPSKVLPRDIGSNNDTTTKDGKAKKLSAATKVAQKSMAKSLIKCRKQKKIGIELLEASVADLNPNNMRKTHQFGNLVSYDPGKYATRPVKKKTTDGSSTVPVSATSSTTEKAGGDKTAASSDTATDSVEGTSIRKDSHEGSVLATEEDEVDAPWNQYAWIEEMQLRVSILILCDFLWKSARLALSRRLTPKFRTFQINGKVPFGSTLRAASSLTRILHGNVYSTTIPSNRAFWEWFLPPILHRNPAGIEGNRRNWASHKPHAVIADGAAMQRVPGSMRFLQKTCQEADVLLFIVNDPRVWGGNTHQDLNDALQDMRKTIKYKIVQQSMRGSSFGRGRLLGQLETEAKWQAKDMGRRTRQAVKDANKRLQQERANDWSKIDDKGLQTKLIHHKVIHVPTADKGDTQPLAPTYTDGMVKLARQCLESLLPTTVERESKPAVENQPKSKSVDSKAVERADAADTSMASVGAWNQGYT